MSVDFTSRDDPLSPQPQDSAFAPTPVYARDTKKKRRTRSVAPAADTGFARPERDVTSGRSIPTAALIAVPAAIVVLGGAFYLMQPRDTGMPPVAENTATAPAALATAPELSTPSPAPIETMPTATPAPVTTPARAERAATPAAEPRRETRVARARPAPSPSASDSGADASATLPATPQPYSATPAPPSATTPQVVTPPPVNEPVNPAPMTADPAPVTPTPAPDAISGATPEVAPSSSTGDGAVTP